MIDLELKRDSRVKRLHSVEGVGSLRLEGMVSRSATAGAEGMSWRFARRRFWSRDIVATEIGGDEVGWYEPRGPRRGGTLHWDGRELILRPASRWRERYALVEGDTELAIFDGKGWGRIPVSLSIDETATVEPGLVLFAAFIVRRLAEDANSAAGAAAATTATG